MWFLCDAARHKRADVVGHSISFKNSHCDARRVTRAASPAVCDQNVSILKALSRASHKRWAAFLVAHPLLTSPEHRWMPM